MDRYTFSAIFFRKQTWGFIIVIVYFYLYTFFNTINSPCSTHQMIGEVKTGTMTKGRRKSLWGYKNACASKVIKRKHCYYTSPKTLLRSICSNTCHAENHCLSMCTSTQKQYCTRPVHLVQHTVSDGSS